MADIPFAPFKRGFVLKIVFAHKANWKCFFLIKAKACAMGRKLLILPPSPQRYVPKFKRKTRLSADFFITGWFIYMVDWVGGL